MGLYQIAINSCHFAFEEEGRKKKQQTYRRGAHPLSVFVRAPPKTQTCAMCNTHEKHVEKGAGGERENTVELFAARVCHVPSVCLVYRRSPDAAAAADFASAPIAYQ